MGADGAVVIVHRRYGRSIAFTEEGIGVRSWLRPGARILSWQDVEFVSPTPAVEHVDGRWRIKDLTRYLSPPPMAPGWVVLDVVVGDLRRAETRSGLRAMPLAPPEDHKGYLRFDLYARHLSTSFEELFAFVATRARYDLLCHRD